MKKNVILLMAAAFAVFSMNVFTSCGDEEEDEEDTVISANITENTTWESGNTYVLAGRIAIESGVTLTIEPGVVVKGEAGSGSNATALIVAQGATIDAEGTADEPIIFTSIADEIQPGEIASPNLDDDMNGLWGGLIVLGYAHISVDGGETTAQIEGIPASDANGLYGGENDADNSGIIKYVSIRHGGSNIGEGNEINGLTLGGVGSGTVIENIEIVANQDDGIEWFGGSVDVSNVLIWNNGDDAIDCDQAWNGTLSNVVIINPGDKCFELDGPEGSYSNGNYSISNVTAYVQGAEGLVDNDDNTNVDMSNLYFTDITVDTVTTLPTFNQVPVDFTYTFSSFEITLPTEEEDGDAISPAITDFFEDGTDTYTTSVSDGANTVGATLSDFTWTWASENDEF